MCTLNLNYNLFISKIYLVNVSFLESELFAKPNVEINELSNSIMNCLVGKLKKSSLLTFKLEPIQDMKFGRTRKH